VGAEWSETWDADVARGGERIWRPELDRRSVLGQVVKDLEIVGPTTNVSAACASGNHALALGREWLAMGLVDVCLAGACDIGITPFSLAGFGNLRALSRRNDIPHQALRPFDRARDGMVLGEGGALFVLERADDARRRGVSPYAEVAGCGARSDSYHMVIPAADPTAAVQALKRALADAEVEVNEIDYINAHATGTPVGDVCETRVLHEALGANALTTPISSTKSMTGHLLSAAAAIEALVCLATIKHGVLPATLNLDDIDPACDLCHVPNQPREQKVRVAVSNSFGFGGNNTSLVLRAVA
jgi:3-oxoacyl-[acyl-carrier-protein] synthase II